MLSSFYYSQDYSMLTVQPEYQFLTGFKIQLFFLYFKAGVFLVVPFHFGPVLERSVTVLPLLISFEQLA